MKCSSPLLCLSGTQISWAPLFKEKFSIGVEVAMGYLMIFQMVLVLHQTFASSSVYLLAPMTQNLLLSEILLLWSLHIHSLRQVYWRILCTISSVTQLCSGHHQTLYEQRSPQWAGFHVEGCKMFVSGGPWRHFLDWHCTAQSASLASSWR